MAVGTSFARSPHVLQVSVGEHGDKESKDLAARSPVPVSHGETDRSFANLFVALFVVRFGFDLKKSNESLYVWFDATASLANSVSRKLKSADGTSPCRQACAHP